MNTPKLAAALLMAISPAALNAQSDTAPAPATADPAPDAGVVVGATVYDPEGNVVGTIVNTGAETAVVDTGTNRAALAKSGFAKGPSGPMIGMTKVQLDQAVANAQKETEAKLATALVAGATVHTSDGVPVGTIREIDASGNVVVDRAAGAISLGKDQFTADANGGPALRFTAAQLEAALGQQTPAAGQS